jgi:hypothetical protein
MDGPDMDSQIEQWRQKAASMGGSAGILSGGDGSAKKKKGVINGAYGWGVYGLGETTVEYWETKKADDVTIMCSGGNVDCSNSGSGGPIAPPLLFIRYNTPPRKLYTC